MLLRGTLREGGELRAWHSAWLLAVGLAGCDEPLPDLRVQPTLPTTPSAPPVVYVGLDASPGASGGDGGGFIHPLPSVEQPSRPRPGDNEPERDPALTFVHGVSDARHIYLCADDQGQLVNDALPVPEGGLEFGERWVLSAEQLDLGAELAWWLVASEQPLPRGVTCGDLAEQEQALHGNIPRDAGTPVAAQGDAGASGPALTDSAAQHDAAALDASLADAAPLDPIPPEAGPGAESRDAAALIPEADAGLAPGAASGPSVAALRIAPFVRLPAMSQQRSTLLVAVGCVGGFVQTDERFCGSDYNRAQTSLGPVFLPLSRSVEYRYLGLQFVNLSTMEQVTLRSTPQPEASGSFFTIGTDVARGEIWPSVARTGVALADLGEDLTQVELQAVLGYGDELLFSQSWHDVLFSSGEPPLVNGRAYSVLLLGSLLPVPVPGIHGARLLLIDNDPARPPL